MRLGGIAIGVVVVLFVLGVSPPASGQTVGDVFRKTSVSVVVIRARGRDVAADGTVRFSEIGSGVLVSADGKVSYRHSTAPFTGRGGLVTQKSWELTKDELKDLFRKLVADGLLEADDSGGPGPGDAIGVTSGRWWTTCGPGVR